MTTSPVEEEVKLEEAFITLLSRISSALGLGIVGFSILEYFQEGNDDRETCSGCRTALQVQLSDKLHNVLILLRCLIEHRRVLWNSLVLRCLEQISSKIWIVFFYLPTLILTAFRFSVVIFLISFHRSRRLVNYNWRRRSET